MVCYNEITQQQVQDCQAVGVKLLKFQDVADAGKDVAAAPSFKKCVETDCPLFSYTSGTTGDSKGVKMTHKSIIQMCGCLMPKITLTHEDSFISYLPYPHSFETGLTYFSIMTGCKIGYYQGDPLKLVEDCALLKPALFPSVPRLYNRIYGKIKERLDGLTGCGHWLA